MISKLTNRYPIANAKEWLSGDYQCLDPIFAGRLAKVGNVYKKRQIITSGYRSYEEQDRLYKLYLAYLKTGRGQIKSASKPGTSSHNYRIAADTSTQPLRSMTNEQLKKYGLCKPIRSEGWHIQPLETMNEKDFAKWEPMEDEVITETQILVDGKIKTVKRILKDGENYIRLRDFDDVLGVVEVDYDPEKKLPIVKD